MPKKTKKTPAVASAELMAAAATQKRPLDGSDNNEANGEWGSAHQQLLRLTPPGYEGQHHTVPEGHKHIPYWHDDNPRRISNLVCVEDTDIADPEGRTHWMWAWGQFLDHQLDLTGESEEVITVEIDPADPHIGGNQVAISFKRSEPAPGTGTRHDAPREHTNLLSAYIDGSSVYGVDEERLAVLLGDGTPFLDTSPGNDGQDLLPINTDLPNAQPDGFAGPFFLAGDVRVNEHVVLTSMHTVFVRLHNVRAQQLIDDGVADPQEIFDRARAWVAAVMQYITYCEFVPELLGAKAVSGNWKYKEYRAGIETGISTEFSTAAYRLGHSMLPAAVPISGDVTFAPGDGGTATDHLDLKNAFFRPGLVAENGTAVFLDRLHTEAMQQIDPRISEGLRNFLFRFPNGAGNEPDFGLLDLAALNIMRGRDHRIARYNDVREGLGLPRVESFEAMGRDPLVAQRLTEAYGTPDNADLWVAGLCETPLAGAAVGETFYTILHDQFVRLRDGDRHYWQNEHSDALTDDERADLAAGNWTLGKVLAATGSVSPDVAAVFEQGFNVFNTDGRNRLDDDHTGSEAAGNEAAAAEAAVDVSPSMPGYPNKS